MSERKPPLADRVALVPGGSGALGQHIVAALAEAGCHAVAVGYGTDVESAERAGDKARALGATASRAVLLPVTSTSDVEAAVRALVEQLSRIDILVYAAGVNEDAVSWRVDDQSWTRVLEVNLGGAHRVTRAVLPSMRAAGFGRILMLSSVVGQIGVPGTSAYAASKAGLFGYARAVAREVAGANITVNVLALGYFDAGMLHRLPGDARARILAQIPLGRFGDPRRLARIVTFLCEEDADYITGQVINVNGGIFG